MAPCGGGTHMLAESSGKFFLLLRDRQSLSLLLRGVLHWERSPYRHRAKVTEQSAAEVKWNHEASRECVNQHIPASPADPEVRLMYSGSAGTRAALGLWGPVWNPLVERGLNEDVWNRVLTAPVLQTWKRTMNTLCIEIQNHSGLVTFPAPPPPPSFAWVSWSLRH